MTASKIKITNETRAEMPRVSFRDIKDAALGEEYSLNLIFVSPSKIKKLNTIYRNIEEPTDILSFPLSPDEGDIYICLTEAKKEAKNFERPYENFIAFLFIHGCVHLKGYDHGGTMDAIEADLRKQFGI